MPGYKHPCKYCGELVPPDSNVCPFCSKVNPFGPVRCPKCRTPVEKKWKTCPNCGFLLEVCCPKCGEKTFFGDYCEKCNARLVLTCPNPKCKHEQPPVSDKCIKCGKPLKVNLRG